MTTPLVSINSAPREQLERLYGVGSRLAERIVQHRESAGPFQGPEDLARVEGFGLELAITLSPHIDWASGAPSEAADTIKVGWGDWLSFACLLMAGAMLWRWIIERELSNGGITLFTQFPHLGWLATLRAILFLLMGACLLTGLSAYLMEDVLPSRSHRALARRIAVLGCTAGTTINVVSGLIVLLANRFEGDIPVGLGFTLTAALAWGPQALVILNPRLASSRKLTIVFDITWFALIPSTAWLAANSPEDTPLFIKVTFGIMGAVGVAKGIQALRGESGFMGEVGNLLEDRATQPKPLWIMWLNTRMPSPQDQRALQAELNRTYPVSRLRTVGGAIVIGAGGWLVITALGAIVEWLIQNWLDGLV